jgi:hypothetical protein
MTVSSLDPGGWSVVGGCRRRLRKRRRQGAFFPIDELAPAASGADTQITCGCGVVFKGRTAIGAMLECLRAVAMKLADFFGNIIDAVFDTGLVPGKALDGPQYGREHFQGRSGVAAQGRKLLADLSNLHK